MLISCLASIVEPTSFLISFVAFNSTFWFDQIVAPVVPLPFVILSPFNLISPILTNIPVLVISFPAWKSIDPMFWNLPAFEIPPPVINVNVSCEAIVPESPILIFLLLFPKSIVNFPSLTTLPAFVKSSFNDEDFPSI